MRSEMGFEGIVREPTSVVTVGTFDGVHLGHQAILTYLQHRAAEHGGIATVVSFDPHPREVVTGEPVPLLTTLDERAALMAAHGVERFVVLPFTRDLSILEADDYVREILVERIGLREIVIGYDHAFGRNRSGNRETLVRLGKEFGFSVDVIPEQMVDESTVSSTRVRAALVETGDAALAAELLGRPYSLTGTVVRGEGRGREIGYPTANLKIEDRRKLIPARGVYAVRVDGLGEGMMNIGVRPTFGDEVVQHLEVHLFDLKGDLYGLDLRIEFVARLRDERRFKGVEELRSQIAQDEIDARAIL